MTDLFVSYSRRNKPFIQKLTATLSEAGRDLWVDWKDIPAVSDWSDEIRSGISEAGAVLFVLSPDWLASGECAKELAYSIETGKRLIPLIFEDVIPANVPPELGKLNWIYARAADDFDTAIQTLQTALDTDLGWVRTHTRLLGRALEWDAHKRENSYLLQGVDLKAAEVDLTQAGGKDPNATPLMGEYVLASRAHANRRQRQLLAGVSVALVVAIVLAIAALWQRGEAVSAQKTAEANEAEAVRQASIATSRQLSAVSDSLRTPNLNVSMLMAVESLNAADTFEARSALLQSLEVSPYIDVFATRHDFWVKDLAFSADSTLIYSVGYDRSLRAYDIAARQSEVLIPELTDYAWDLIYNPAGKTFATSAGNNPDLTLWDAATDLSVGPSGNSTEAWTTAISPDARWVASSLGDGSAQVWDVDARAALGESISFSGPGRVTAFAFDGSSSILAVARCETTDPDDCASAVVSAWSLPDLDFLGSFSLLEAPTPAVTRLAFSPDGSTLFTGDWDTIGQWDWQEGVLLDDLEEPDSLSNFVTGLPDGEIGWTTERGAPGVRYGTLAESEFVPLAETKSMLGGLVALYTPQSAWTVGDRGGLLWRDDYYTGTRKSWVGHAGAVTTLAASHDPEGKWLASGSADGQVILWRNVPLGETPLNALSRGEPAVSYPDTSPDGRFGASHDGPAHEYTLFATAGDRELTRLPGTTGASGRFSPDSRRFASLDCSEYADGFVTCTAGTIHVLDLETLAVSEIPLSLPTSLWTFTPGGLLALAGSDGLLFLDPAGETEPTRLLAGQDFTGNAFAVNAAQTLFAVSDCQVSGGMCAQGRIRLHSLPDGALVTEMLAGWFQAYTALAFSPDGRILAATRPEGVELWDVSLGRIYPYNFSNAAWVVFSADNLRFDPDGATLTASLLGTQQLVNFTWNTDPSSWAGLVCARAGRSMTQSEWDQYLPGQPYHATCP